MDAEAEVEKFLAKDDPEQVVLDHLKEEEKNKEKGKAKKKKSRVVSYKRHKGQRTFPYKCQNRSSKTKVDTSEHLDTLADETTSEQENVDVTEHYDFEETVMEAMSLVQDTNLVSGTKKRSWQERNDKHEASWDGHRERLLDAVKVCFQISGICEECGNAPAVSTCNECRVCRCAVCDIQKHNAYPTHNRSSFVHGYMATLAPSEALDENNQIVEVARFVPLRNIRCSCGSSEYTMRETGGIKFVVTLTGRFTLKTYLIDCSSCGERSDPFNLENIIRSGFWPSSPTSFGYLFELEVFMLWDQFRKRMPGSSEVSFLNSLDELTLINGREGKINHNSFTHAFKNWNFINFELDKLQQKHWVNCPCCKINQHSCHIDGNCKLYRYKSSGRRSRQSYYQDVFIVDDSKLDDFLSSLNIEIKRTSKTDQDTVCGGEWTAARNVPRKSKSLDVTGLEVLACRHQFGQKALNMKRGEIFAYAFYLINNFAVMKNVTYVYADVMCKLWKYLVKMDPTITNKIVGALSVMHAKGHKLDCQLTWDGEWIDGTGRSTGEECEQIFSYLSRCGNTTKYQKPENREETLTELMLFWNQRKTNNLAEALFKRFKTVSLDREKYQSAMQNLLKKLSVGEDDVDFEAFLTDIRFAAAGGDSRKINIGKVDALILLTNHMRSSLPIDVPEKILKIVDQLCLPDLSGLNIPILKKNKIEKESLLSDSLYGIKESDVKNGIENLLHKVLVPTLQDAIEATYFQLVCWKKRIHKYADTSKQRSVSWNNMSRCKDKLKELTEKLSQLQTVPCAQDDIFVGKFPWNIAVTNSNKRILVDNKMRIKRCSEELLLIEKDMESYLKYYSAISSKLKAEIDSLEAFGGVINEVKKGHASILRLGLIYSEKQLLKGVKMFCTLLSPEILNRYQIPVDVDVTIDETIEFSLEDEVDDCDFFAQFSNHVPVTDYAKGLMDDFEPDDCMKLIDAHHHLLRLPAGFSQSDLNGRNGSSACTVICVVTGFIMTNSESLLSSIDQLMDIVPVFVGCMEIGNTLYKDSELLSVGEALMLVPWQNLKILVEKDCLAIDICKTIASFPDKSKSFIVVVTNERSVCVVRNNANVFLFDSHRHHPAGALLVKCSISNLEPLARSISMNRLDNIYMCSVSQLE